MCARCSLLASLLFSRSIRWSRSRACSRSSSRSTRSVLRAAARSASNAYRSSLCLRLDASSLVSSARARARARAAAPPRSRAAPRRPSASRPPSRSRARARHDSSAASPKRGSAPNPRASHLAKRASSVVSDWSAARREVRATHRRSTSSTARSPTVSASPAARFARRDSTVASRDARLTRRPSVISAKCARARGRGKARPGRATGRSPALGRASATEPRLWASSRRSPWTVFARRQRRAAAACVTRRPFFPRWFVRTSRQQLPWEVGPACFPRKNVFQRSPGVDLSTARARR